MIEINLQRARLVFDAMYVTHCSFRCSDQQHTDDDYHLQRQQRGDWKNDKKNQLTPAVQTIPRIV